MPWYSEFLPEHQVLIDYFAKHPEVLEQIKAEADVAAEAVEAVKMLAHHLAANGALQRPLAKSLLWFIVEDQDLRVEVLRRLSERNLLVNAATRVPS